MLRAGRSRYAASPYAYVYDAFAYTRCGCRELSCDTLLRAPLLMPRLRAATLFSASHAEAADAASRSPIRYAVSPAGYAFFRAYERRFHATARCRTRMLPDAMLRAVLRLSAFIAAPLMPIDVDTLI